MVCKLPNAKHFSISARKTILIKSRTVIVMHCRWSVCQKLIEFLSVSAVRQKIKYS